MPVPRLLSLALPSLALTAALALPVAAHADTLYNQPFAETAAGGYFSSALASYLQYDSFVLANGGSIESAAGTAWT